MAPDLISWLKRFLVKIVTYCFSSLQVLKDDPEVPFLCLLIGIWLLLAGFFLMLFRVIPFGAVLFYAGIIAICVGLIVIFTVVILRIPKLKHKISDLEKFIAENKPSRECTKCNHSFSSCDRASKLGIVAALRDILNYEA